MEGRVTGTLLSRAPPRNFAPKMNRDPGYAGYDTITNKQETPTKVDAVTGTCAWAGEGFDGSSAPVV